MGNRIAKHVEDNTTGLPEKSTYYILDAQGNTLNTYEHVIDNTNATVAYNLQERQIYGSSRLGIYDDKLTLVGANQPVSGAAFYHEQGHKYYEMSNHLGNVLTVITDKKTPLSSNGTTVDNYQVHITNVSDYSPFGVTLDGRTMGDSTYRYSFQGQEKDDEIKGAGNAINYKYRMHDPRVGRFFAVDPLASKYPHNSPYAFSENRVLDGIELEGLEWQPVDADGNNVGTKSDKIANYTWVGYTKLVGYSFGGEVFETYEAATTAFYNDFKERNGIAPPNNLTAMAIGKAYEAAEGTVSEGAAWISDSERKLFSVEGRKPKTETVDAVTITVYRYGTSSSTGNTMGIMIIPNGEEEGTRLGFSTLEPEGPATTTANQDQRIPTGTYHLVKRAESRGSFNGGWYMLENADVSHHRGIYVHYGADSDAWTEGCIVLGNCDINGDFVRNDDSVGQFNGVIDEYGIDNSRIRISESENLEQ